MKKEQNPEEPWYQQWEKLVGNSISRTNPWAEGSKASEHCLSPAWTSSRKQFPACGGEEAKQPHTLNLKVRGDWNDKNSWGRAMERRVMQKNSSRKWRRSSLESWLKTTHKVCRIKCQKTKQLSAAVSQEKVKELTPRWESLQSSLTGVGDCKLCRGVSRGIKRDIFWWRLC